MYIQAKQQYEDPLDCTKTTFDDWDAKDAQICLRMWNSIDLKISSNLIYLDKAKQVWTRTREMFPGVSNLRHTYDLHQASSLYRTSMASCAVSVRRLI